MSAEPDSTAFHELVVKNPNIMGGAPVFAGTRVPIATFFDYLAQGLSLDYFIETFPSVERHQAMRLLNYCSTTLQHEAA